MRTVDQAGESVPFCSVVLCERNPKDRKRLTWFRQFGTDDRGIGYYDQLTGPFSINVQRFDVLSEQLVFRYHVHRHAKIHELATPAKISVKCDDFPTGTGTISGRVYDDDGRPLTGYVLMIERTEREADGAGEYDSGTDVPVIDDGGRFTVGGLPPGDYVLRAADFDTMRHVWPNAVPPRVHLPDEDGAEVTVDVELEARELRYGRAVDEEGKPLANGGWVAQLARAHNPFLMKSMSFAPDGSFRVSLSKKERRKSETRVGGLVKLATFDRQAHALVRFSDLSPDPARPTVVVLRNGDEEPLAPRALVGSKPDFRLRDSTGGAHRLSDYRGKVVLLNFFDTTCVPCMKEWPHLVELSEKRSKAGLVVLAICHSPAEVLRDFVDERKPPFAVLIDDELDAAAAIRDDRLNVPLPTNVLIDRRGRIAYVSEDFTDGSFPEVSAKVDELIKQPKPARSGAAKE